MKRHAFALEILYERKGAFCKKLGEIWPEVTAFLDEVGVKNFSIWNTDYVVFGYGETADDVCLSEAQKEEMDKIVSKMDGLVNWISRPGVGMRLMYENFGYVRENKELIRHRMFMTRLKPGCAEEYKIRHDGLAAARNGKPDPGPDSNFSIWSAGGYIFGYNEIDITMETDETPEMHASTVEWETRQLGIMDWITNDVDWLTGTVHSQSRRLAWHN